MVQWGLSRARGVQPNFSRLPQTIGQCAVRWKCEICHHNFQMYGSNPRFRMLFLLRWPRPSRKAQCNGLASVRLSVCPVGILTVTHQEAACDAASLHFGPTIGRTDILVVVRTVEFISMLNKYQRINVLLSRVNPELLCYHVCLLRHEWLFIRVYHRFGFWCLECRIRTITPI